MAPSQRSLLAAAQPVTQPTTPEHGRDCRTRGDTEGASGAAGTAGLFFHPSHKIRLIVRGWAQPPKGKGIWLCTDSPADPDSLPGFQHPSLTSHARCEPRSPHRALHEPRFTRQFIPVPLLRVLGTPALRLTLPGTQPLALRLWQSVRTSSASRKKNNCCGSSGPQPFCTSPNTTPGPSLPVTSRSTAGNVLTPPRRGALPPPRSAADSFRA